MIKYASNAVLATMISFSNEIARLCTAVGDVDAIEVMRGVHQAAYFTMRRGGERLTAPITSFLEPGCGFGGSCLPKDVTALVGQGREKGLALGLLQSVLDINRGQPDEMMRLIGRHFAVARRMCRSRCSASPSSPTPTTCASRRRFPSSGRSRPREPA